MKQVTRKSLLSFLVVALLAIVCAFGVMSYNNSSKGAMADVAVPEASVYQAATLADEADFSMEAGAGVETTTTGIKFTALVSEDFHQAGYTYFATAKLKGGSVEQAVAFTAEPKFTDGVAKLSAYINGFGELTDAAKIAATKAEWIVNAYAYDGDVCFKAANGGEDNLQSMGMVAANAALDYTTADEMGYDKEDITSYFVKSNFAEGVNGYTGEDGIFYISFAGAPAEGAEVYINNELMDVDNNELMYDNDIARYMGYYEAAESMEPGTINKAFLFAADGGVYATKIAQGTPIASEADMTAYFTGDVEGYYYLTSDIVMANAWNAAANLYGSFDGQGYTISNIKYTGGAYTSMFNPYGGTVKNVGFQVVSHSTHAGLIYGWGGDKQDSYIKNVFVDVVPSYHSCALVERSAGGHHTIEDAIVIKRGSLIDTTTNQSIINHFGNSSDDKTVPATWTVKNVHATANGQGVSTTGGVIGYSDFYALKVATEQIRSFEQNRAIKQFNTWIAVNQDNAVTELQNFTQNELIYLEEDVDVSSVTSWTAAQGRMGTGNDGRVFIGNGHTVSGINLTAHTNPGFFGGARGILVKDAGFVFNAITGNNQGGLFGNVTKSTNILENIMVSVTEFKPYSGGMILRNPEANANFIVKNFVANFGSATLNNNNGLLIGNLNQGSTFTFENVAVIRPDGGLTQIQNPANTGNVITGEVATYTSIEQFATGANANATLVALAKNTDLIVEITQENALDIFTKVGLTSGYYSLAEDLDFDGAIVNGVSAAFTGFFNGNGHVIRNVKTRGLLAGAMNGKAIVKNVGFQNVDDETTGGVLAKQTNNSNASNILIENVVVSMYDNSSAYGLIGQSVGMKVTFRNVVYNFEISTSTTAGYVGTTSLSGTKVFDKFIGVGSIATVTNATSRPDAIDNTHIAGFYGGGDNGWGTGYEYGPDGKSAPVADKDYFACTSFADFATKLENNTFGLPAETLALVAKTGLDRKITKDNISTLQYAANGTYYLAEDIDMSQVDLNGDGIADANDVWTSHISRKLPFVGVLDGQGHSITNLKLDGKLYNGFIGAVGAGALVKNIKVEAVSQGHINATLFGIIESGYADIPANSKVTFTDGRVKGQINVVNSVISSADLDASTALITMFYNSNQTLILTDVVLMATGAYDGGYAVTDGGGNKANLTANNVLVIVADESISWVEDAQGGQLTGELVYAADSTIVETMYAENNTVLGFFGLDPK